jgi:hypothetical protein
MIVALAVLKGTGRWEASPERVGLAAGILAYIDL